MATEVMEVIVVATEAIEAMGDMEVTEDMGMEDMDTVVKQYASTSISASSFTRFIFIF